MKLGEYTFDKPVILAPMAGITDKAFREIVSNLGGKYTVTEMISDKALLHNNSKTIQMLNLEGEQSPRIVQIFGSEPDTMAEAAKVVVTYGADVIDINMGCPTPKIVKNGEGSALMKNLPLAEKIADRVVRAVNVPVTTKMRLGWDESDITAPELAGRLESVGISMITVHARTREQFYSGQADWKYIRLIKNRIKIPLVGNGDITSPEDALMMLETTGCDGVMIGRSALGNPWLLGQTQRFLDNPDIKEPEVDNNERLKIIIMHFEKIIGYKGHKIGVNEMRKHAAWYFKGMRKAAEYRNEVMKTHDPEVMKDIFRKAFSLQEPSGSIDGPMV